MTTSTRRVTGRLSVLNASGDTLLAEWDTDVEATVGEAMAKLDAFLAAEASKGHHYEMFRSEGAEGDDVVLGRRMEAFDPSAGRAVLFRRLAGG